MNPSGRCWRWGANWPRRSRRAFKIRPREYHAFSPKRSATRNAPCRACTLPEPTAKARRRRCSNRSCAPRDCAPGFTLRRISSESTSASASTARISRTKISPRPGRACTPSSNRCWRPANSRRIRRFSSASRRWRSSPSRRANVDFAVYEVGLGGRLDATNIVVAGSRRHHAHRFRPREFSRPFDRGNRRKKRESSSPARGW